jgi:hypothetical protein
MTKHRHSVFDVSPGYVPPRPDGVRSTRAQVKRGVGIALAIVGAGAIAYFAVTVVLFLLFWEF